ncbi:GNAT family N-acetyltransferase [Bradyrhizobium sp. Leo121]|uniref:GNAT family N-acetyltransferase n=1 Tax=Bradyrhizobium sp. Leo121 TaxID=1571195 RepID=UPI0013EF3B1E|nr:GNAT family N-acetyltransferase [Bradyrhizobium sp. Leo121]
MEPSLICAADADFEEIALFQQRCFEGQVGEAERAAVQTFQHYVWKYTLLQPARIAELRRNGQLVAMCAAFPVQLSAGGDPMTGWQICDIATIPPERRKGYFKACLAVLTDTLPSTDVFFGFPNSRSAPQLTAMGWRHVDTLSPFVGIIPNLTAIETVHRVERFGGSHDLLVRNFGQSDRLRIVKSSAYMNARYCSALRPIYSCYVARNGAEDCGWIVLRTLRLFGVRVSVIMDSFAVDAISRKLLIRHAGFWSRQQGCLATVSFNNQWRMLDLLRCGLIEIPSLLMPRPLVLMVSGKRGGSTDHWHSYVGDWDGL